MIESKKNIISFMLSLAMLSLGACLPIGDSLASSSQSIVAYAEETADSSAGYTLLGDVDLDGEVSVLDILTIKKHILGIESITGATALANADMNLDNSINAIDLCLMKKAVLFGNDNTTGTDDNGNNSNTDSDGDIDTVVDDSPYIVAPIDTLYGSLPSQGDAKLVVFYVDFPDCTYTNKLSTEEVQEIAFGSVDEDSANYPFESMTAFYHRSSKGAVNLSGQVFSYTAKYPIAYYNDNKVALAEECFDAFDDTVDFSVFDGDGDGTIDATLFTVPNDDNDDYWWPCAGGFGDYYYTVDGMSVGHIITGNVTPDDVKDFNSSYLHEMGHCFGLPDYYLYYSNDEYDGMSGSAGTELMDYDAYSDFGAFSKLMLGWYRENQVQVYDSTSGTQTFTLTNAQTDNGNCVIIPCGTLDSNYFSEYFIVEYSTDTANNCAINTDRYWYQSCESGIRIYHIKADMYDNGWWKFLKYENGSEYTNQDDDGIRLIRLVNDGNGCFKTGDTVDSSTSGFGWYDSSENETIDPNVKISIGELDGDSYTITITPTN